MREISEAEKLEIATLRCGDLEGQELLDHAQMIQGCIIDNYMSDGPGFAGKLALVVWSGGPEYHDCIVWRNGKPEHVMPDGMKYHWE